MENDWTAVIKSKAAKENSVSRGEYNGFRISLEKLWSGDVCCITIAVDLQGNEGSMAMLVDFRLSIGSEIIEVDRDMWMTKEEVFSTSTPKNEDISLDVRMIEMLPVVNLDKPTPYRNFQILCGPTSYYLDPCKLVEIGGKLFSEWKDKQDSGETRAVADMDQNDLKVLVDATARFDNVIVHRRNFQQLSGLAEKYRMLSVLRSIETYLMSSRIDVVRKLEYAVELRMARLFELASRQLGPPHQALPKIHRYLRDNGNTLNDVHKMLLTTFGIQGDNICIA